MKLMKKMVLATATLGLLAGVNLSAQAKTLVYCSEASPEGFDAAAYTSGATLDASSRTVYNRLVEFERGTTNVIPGLAESYDVSDDGLEYIFHLRKGVKFQTTPYFTPSRDFNADDVIFSFERQWKKENPWYSYNPGMIWEYFDSMDMGNLLKDIQKIDDHTVKFVLTRPEAPFLANLAMDFASIVSKEYSDKLQAEGKMQNINLYPVGTGPFTFVAYQKDAVVRYKANPDYYLGKEKIDNLVFAITLDPSIRAQKLKAGECHIAVYPAPADIEGLKADKNLKVLEQAGLNVGYLAYNTEEAPFDNVKVRQALNMAVNKQAIVDAVYQGTGIVEKNPIPQTIWSYNHAIKDDVYDPEKAKKILADEGVKNLEMKIWAMPVSRPYMPNARRAAELIQADYAKVGVKAEIVSMEWGEYLSAANESGRDGAMIIGWAGDNGDPDNFMGLLNSCAAIGTNNYARWCYKPYEDIILKAKTTTDKAERIKLYEQAQEIFKEQAPWLVIASSRVFMPMSNKVKDYVILPTSVHSFEGVDIEE